jgi:hypothetical protein
MKNILRAVFVVCSALLMSGPAFSQQPVAPPPKPAADGPSLADTMQFIQAKLSERGRINFAVYTHDNADGKDYIDQYSTEATSIVADPVACTISYHRNVKRNGAAFAEGSVSFSLRDVQDLAVMPLEQEFKRAYAAAGHPTWDPRVDPSMFLVMARKAASPGNGFYFLTEEMANRVAKAMVHAVELCGGGSKEPF